MMARSHCDPVVAQQRSHVVRMYTLHIKGNALLDTGSSDALWLLEKKNDVVAIPPYFDDFFGNPYTYIKARYYMYASVLLVFVLLRTHIKPNSLYKKT